MGKVNKRVRKFAQKGHLKKVKSSHKQRKKWRKPEKENDPQKKTDARSKSQENQSSTLGENQWVKEYTHFFDTEAVLSPPEVEQKEPESLNEKASKILKGFRGASGSTPRSKVDSLLDKCEGCTDHLQAAVRLHSQWAREGGAAAAAGAALTAGLPAAFRALLLSPAAAAGEAPAGAGAAAAAAAARPQKSPRWGELREPLREYLGALLERMEDDEDEEDGKAEGEGEKEERGGAPPAAAAAAAAAAAPLLAAFPGLGRPFAAAAVRRALGALLGEGEEEETAAAAAPWLRAATAMAEEGGGPAADCVFEALYLAHGSLAGGSGGGGGAGGEALRAALAGAAAAHPGAAYLHLYVYTEALVRRRAAAALLDGAQQRQGEEAAQQSATATATAAVADLGALAAAACSAVAAAATDAPARALLPLLLQIAMDIACSIPENSKFTMLRLELVKIMHKICSSSDLYCPSTSWILSTIEAIPPSAVKAGKPRLSAALSLLAVDLAPPPPPPPPPPPASAPLGPAAASWPERATLAQQALARLGGDPGRAQLFDQCKGKLKSFDDMLTKHLKRAEALREITPTGIIA